MQEKEIIEKLNKIDVNTTATLAKLSMEKEEMAGELNEFSEKEENRKEQLKEAQKKFKTIGFKAREEVYEKYEEFAKEEMGMSSLSAFMREYSMLLIENRDFQAIFKEFQILQKNDEEHSQISFFATQTQVDELEEIADNAGYTIGQLTKSLMLELVKNETIREELITKIKGE